MTRSAAPQGRAHWQPSSLAQGGARGHRRSGTRARAIRCTTAAWAAIVALTSACGGAPEPPPPTSNASAVADATPKPATKLHVGLPRPLRSLVQPLRIASRLGRLDRFTVVAAAPAAADASAPTYALVADDAESATMVADAMEVTTLELEPPPGAARRPLIRRLKSRAALRPSAADTGEAGGEALPAGTLVLALVGEGSGDAGPVEVIAAGDHTGWIDGAMLEASDACVPEVGSLTAAGAPARKRDADKSKRDPDAHAIWVEAGPHRLLLATLPELQAATLARFTIAGESCVATPDGAGFYLEGTLHDVRVEGDGLVIQYRDGASEAIAEQAWIPEAGKTAERIRPEARDKAKLVAALARSSAALEGDLLLCAPDEPTATEPKTLGAFLAAQRKRSRATRVVCVPGGEDGSRRCTAEFGSLDDAASGAYVEVEFTVTDAEVRPTSCLRL